MAHTNNFDIARTMKTVLAIIVDFIQKHPFDFVVIKANSETKMSFTIVFLEIILITIVQFSKFWLIEKMERKFQMACHHSRIFLD